MHICMVGVKGIPLPAGIDQVVEQVGTRLVKRGHNVTAFVRGHYTPTDRKEYQGIRLEHVPSIRTRSLDALSSSLFATMRAVGMKPDVVHIHSQGLSVYAPFPRLFGVRTIVHSHGLDWQRAKWGGMASRMIRMTDYTTVAWPDRTVVVSRKLKAYYEKKFHRRVDYIPNGAANPNRLPADGIRKWGLQGKDYLLFAARLVPEKWCDGLIRAYQRIKNPSYPLVIAGDSNYGDAYASELKRNASENIRFTGFATGSLMQELYSNAYAYILPSSIEGLSTGLLEAMSYGNCVLVSDIEENLEVIGESGISFRSGDEADLQAKLEMILADDGLVKTMGEKASRRVSQEYDWEKITDQFVDLYSEMLAR